MRTRVDIGEASAGRTFGDLLFAASWFAFTFLAWSGFLTVGQALFWSPFVFQKLPLLAWVTWHVHPAAPMRLALPAAVACQAWLVWRRGHQPFPWLLSSAPWIVTSALGFYGVARTSVDAAVLSGAALGGAAVSGASCLLHRHRTAAVVVGLAIGALLGAEAGARIDIAILLESYDDCTLLGIFGVALAQLTRIRGAGTKVSWMVATVLPFLAMRWWQPNLSHYGAGPTVQFAMIQNVILLLPGAALGLFTAVLAPRVFPKVAEGV